MMKRMIPIGLLIVAGLMLSSCANTRQNRTLAGAGVGAVGGGLLGSAVTGGSTTGTMIGAGAGAVGGGMLGNSIK